MSEKAPSAATSAVVSAVVAAASTVDVEKNAGNLLKERFDDDFQSKVKKLQRMKFKGESDLIQRWPYASSELSEEDGVYEWQQPGHTSYIVLTQDIVEDILEAEWPNLPNACGRTKFASYLKARYVGGPSQPQVTAFLDANDEHQIYRQRRRSQRTATSVAQAPFKQLAVDLTDIPKRGVYRYLLVIVDLFSKFCWCTPLAKKSGEIVAREIQKIFDSLPTGARVGSLRSDNGTEFKNPELRAVLDKTNTKQVFGLPGNPLANGAVESLNRTIKVNLFSDIGTDKSVGSFAPALKKTIVQYNTTVQSSTGFVPALLNTPNLSGPVVAEVLKRLNAQAQGRDVNARYQPFLMPGDKVRIEVGELLSAIRLQQKAGSYKPSHENTYSREVFTVVRQDADRFVTVAERPKEKFSRGACLKVPQDAKNLSAGADAVEEEIEPQHTQKKQKRVSQTANLPVTRELRSAAATASRL
jgi:transposase InsO family protein